MTNAPVSSSVRLKQANDLFKQAKEFYMEPFPLTEEGDQILWARIQSSFQAFIEAQEEGVFQELLEAVRELCGWEEPSPLEKVVDLLPEGLQEEARLHSDQGDFLVVAGWAVQIALSMENSARSEFLLNAATAWWSALDEGQKNHQIVVVGEGRGFGLHEFAQECLAEVEDSPVPNDYSEVLECLARYRNSVGAIAALGFYFDPKGSSHLRIRLMETDKVLRKVWETLASKGLSFSCPSLKTLAGYDCGFWNTAPGADKESPAPDKWDPLLGESSAWSEELSAEWG
jgi:hypothetical protein